MPGAAPVSTDVRVRWLGTAGVELEAGGGTLVIDPFLTRPPLWRFLLGRVQPDADVIAGFVDRCDYVLVSHSHYDHLLDVPEIASRTGAQVYGSPNTCGIAAACHVPASQVNEVISGQVLSLGPFLVEVLEAEHVKTPIDWLINGPLAPDLSPPLRLRDYRMDRCFGFRILVGGTRIVHSPGRAFAGELLLLGTHAPDRTYEESLPAAQAKTVVPIHWDDFLRPLARPVRELPNPGGRDLDAFLALVHRILPQARQFVPAIARSYSLADLGVV
jgi:L-ascorbate metabolism protein UlaG (beta-lactamase superfamily)